MAWEPIANIHGEQGPAGTSRELWIGDSEPTDWKVGDYWLRTSNGVAIDMNVCTSKEAS